MSNDRKNLEALARIRDYIRANVELLPKTICDDFNTVADALRGQWAEDWCVFGIKDPSAPKSDRTKALLESFAFCLAKQARYESLRSVASMIAVDFGRDGGNFLSQEEVNEFFTMFQRSKDRLR